VLLAAIVLLGAVIRFLTIGSRLHLDDAYTWLVASQPNPHAFLRQLAATENTPPLSYLLLTPLPINHPAWLRLPAALAGSLLAPALFVAVRRPLGRAASLLAALAVAVAPFLITDSDIARGFMLEDLALLIAVWAALRLADAPDASRRWWVVFALAGTIAVYTEYSAAIFIVSLVLAALWLGGPRRGMLAAAGAVPFAALIPWIPQIVRGQHQVGVTKLHPVLATTSLSRLRDVIVLLAFGERGGTSSPAGRWVEVAVLLALGCAGAVVIRRRRHGMEPGRRYAVSLLALTGVLTLAGHALGPLIGIDVFSERYLTILVPLAAALGAVALTAPGRTWVVRGAAVLLAGLGAVELARRYHGEYEPSLAPVRQAAERLHPRSVLTDTPLVVFYLRSLHPRLDRPSNLGRGLAGACSRPCLIVDDTRTVGGAPRVVSRSKTMIGPYLLTVER